MLNQEIIEDLLTSTGREGMANLLQYMRESGFYISPCSTQYHLCKEGGLAEHSLNVKDTIFKVAESLYTSETIAQIEDSLIIVSLLHDLGKCGQYGKPGYVENFLKNGKKSDSKPYEVNKALLSVPHEIRSIQIISQFITLTENESFAILYHNSLYGDLKYAYSGKETPLSMLLHFSDLWCAKTIEV